MTLKQKTLTWRNKHRNLKKENLKAIDREIAEVLESMKGNGTITEDYETLSERLKELVETRSKLVGDKPSRKDDYLITALKLVGIIIPTGVSLMTFLLAVSAEKNDNILTGRGGFWKYIPKIPTPKIF